MSDNTKIEWTDATANVINGCSLESPGCTNCYAMKQAHRFPVRQGLTKQSKGGMVWTGEVRFHEPALLKVLSWKRQRSIFWNAHGDMFHPDVPDEWIDRCFAVMALTPQHIHQVLTKRSARMREYLNNPQMHLRVAMTPENMKAQLHSVETMYRALPLPNVWLGVSVEDQQRADERIPDLLATPAAVRWLSCEPLLGPVDIKWALGDRLDCAAGFLRRGQFSPGLETLRPLDWIVCGGESGPGARPMHPDWARSLRDQCADAGMPFFFKQWGEWAPDFDQGRTRQEEVADLMPDGMRVVHPNPLTIAMFKVGKKPAGRLLDGVLHDAMPRSAA